LFPLRRAKRISRSFCNTSTGKERKMITVMAENYLTIQQAAERLSCNERTIRRFIEFEKLPAFKMGDKSVRIKESDLKSFMDSRKIDPKK
jgi:excisionase family DNA binding protein